MFLRSKIDFTKSVAFPFKKFDFNVVLKSNGTKQFSSQEEWDKIISSKNVFQSKQKKKTVGYTHIRNCRKSESAYFIETSVPLKLPREVSARPSATTTRNLPTGGLCLTVSK
jgi:hypothetical protein